jgi:hypothetical protein
MCGHGQAKVSKAAGPAGYELRMIINTQLYAMPRWSTGVRFITNAGKAFCFLDSP